METVFERVWKDTSTHFIYKNETAGVGIIPDAFPKFPDQVVLIPAEGQPANNEASLSDLPHSTYLALACLQSVIGRKMEYFPGVRAITRVDGFAVPNHPHIVMFPALRGESDAYTRPSRFSDPNVRRILVERTMQNLALSEEEVESIDTLLADLPS